MVEPGIIISALLAGLGGVVWAVRIEGRVNAHQTLFDEREKLAEGRHESLENRLIRIERKLDENGHSDSTVARIRRFKEAGDDQ